MLGVSTHAYAWRRHPDNPAPWTVADVLTDARRLGVPLVQICDVAELEGSNSSWLAETRAAAVDLGLTLETGTKGIEPAHLAAHLERSLALGSTLVRSMLSSPRSAPTLEDATAALRKVMPSYEDAGVTLALETYEQFSTSDLVRLVSQVDSPNLGICLDPGNCVARLESPTDVVRASAPHVVNLHVKDFAFRRSEDMIGFTFAGAPLGTGLLDYDGVVDCLDAVGRRVNHVIEHWLTRRTSLQETCHEERRWIDDSVAWLMDRARA